MKLTIAVTALIIVITSSNAVFAKCRKAQVCDDYGMNCQVRQICESSLDLPSVGVDPLRSLPSTRLKPLPSIGLPPIGTRKCEYKQVNGIWQNVCK